MTRDEADAAARNVLQGKTASGAVMFNPLGFPKHDDAFRMLSNWTWTYANHSMPPPERMLTNYIRKLACYVTRTWPTNMNDTALLDGTIWFIDNPANLLGNMGLAQAARLRSEQLRRLIKAEERWARDLAAQTYDTPEPPCPVLLNAGGFTLVELTDPRHLIRAGESAGNCLVHHHGNIAYANPSYAGDVIGGRLHIYALSKETTLCCVFSAGEGELHEIHLVHPDLVTERILDACIEAVTRLLGPLNDMFCDIHIDDEPSAETGRSRERV